MAALALVATAGGGGTPAPSPPCRGSFTRSKGTNGSRHLPRHPRVRDGGSSAIAASSSLTSSAQPRATTSVAAASDGAASDGSWSYLVTGAAGFIGSHLVEALLSKGAAVVAVDSLDRGGPYPIEWKVSNVALLRRVAEEHEREGARLLFRELDAGDRESMRALFAGDDAGVPGSDGAEEFSGAATDVTKTTMPPVARVCHLGGGGKRAPMQSSASRSEQYCIHTETTLYFVKSQLR